MALIGFNVTGIAIIIGDVAMVPIGKSGKVEKRPREALKKWIKLDTGKTLIPCWKNDKGVDLSWSLLDGTELGCVGCMQIFEHILIQVVPDLLPLDSPSSLMTKVLAGKK